jgi:hypothetical protein
MTEPEDHVVGPVDFILIEAQEENLTGEAGAALLDLVDRGIIRLYDLLIIRKDADGTFSGIDITDLDADSFGGLAAFSGARSGLLGDDDLAEAAEALAPGTVAALIVYENLWAVPFVAAARRAGAELVASARIPAGVINDVLDALDAADAAN